MKGSVIVEEGYTFAEETHLTVLKTSRFFIGDGFSVYDCNGEVVFRVDSYGGQDGDNHDTDEVVLMNVDGHCLLTVRRKRPSLHQRWEGFLGEGLEGQKPIFSVRRSSIIGRSSVTVDVYGNPGEEYQIDGSFPHRCCTIYNTSSSHNNSSHHNSSSHNNSSHHNSSSHGGKEVVAEIRRKVDASTSVVLGKDVFSLCIKPGFDGAFAMGLVLILDQINGGDFVEFDDDDDDDEENVLVMDPPSSNSSHSSKLDAVES